MRYPRTDSGSNKSSKSSDNQGGRFKVGGGLPRLAGVGKCGKPSEWYKKGAAEDCKPWDQCAD